jgi:hypothetical protein
MPGKRTTDNARAHHGPEEDRARKPSQDRARGKLRARKQDPETEGLTAKEQARIRRFRAS